LVFRPGWDPETAPPERHGLFATDPRVRTLVRVLLSYPEVRYVVPDRVSLDPGSSPPMLESVARFLDRQGWLVERVHVG
jgi:hypothetical protein